MCDDCKELDEKIEHYRNLSKMIADKKTVDGLIELIAELKAKRFTLHPGESS